ncbi:hypothetical protein ACJJJB_16700 [Microbulbifer sp. ANSA001]|uniref:hypothetical protein n=1 Tax=Microbulbifer sp. ANSA001 TaxID=3243358 RepID=UPI00404316E3
MKSFYVEIPALFVGVFSVVYVYFDDFAAKVGYALHTSQLPVGCANNRSCELLLLIPGRETGSQLSGIRQQ